MRIAKDLSSFAALHFILLVGIATCSPKAAVDDRVRAALQENRQAVVLVKLRLQNLDKAATPEEKTRQIQRLQDAVLSVQILDQNNRGFVPDWIAGVDHIVANNSTLKVKIINMSLVVLD